MGSQHKSSKAKSTFKNGLAQRSALRMEVIEEPEHCAPSSSWRPTVNRSLHRIVRRAFKAIASFKVFVPSVATKHIEYEIHHTFQCIRPVDDTLFLYDTDSDDSSDDEQRYRGQNCHIPLMDFEVEAVRLECPRFEF